jgi:peroxiredoxin family protein
MSESEKVIMNAAVLRGEKKVLSCAQAVKLSKEHNISLKEIGEACNQHGIKLIECQLGCFE